MNTDAALLRNILERAAAIQQIPAPTFYESARAAFIHQSFLTEGLREVSVDPTGNVYGCLPGSGLASPVVVSAHLDTVFPASTALRIAWEPDKLTGPGIGDNALGLAGLFGLVWSLREGVGDRTRSGLPGDVWLVANVGEEGLGNLRGMRAVVERFAELPLAYIVLEGMALGQVYHRGLGVRRYRITADCAGGHSWVDFGAPSAIHELAGLVTRLTAIPLPEHPRTSLNVGVIQGGTSVNTIAPQAHLELDLRSEGVDELSDLQTQVEQLMKTSNRPGVSVTAEVIGDRPVGEISVEHALVQLAVRSLEAVGVEACLNIGSTDANVPLSYGFPAVCLGLTKGSSAHTENEYIFTQPLAQGFSHLLMVIKGVFEV